MFHFDEICEVWSSFLNLIPLIHRQEAEEEYECKRNVIHMICTRWSKKKMAPILIVRCWIIRTSRHRNLFILDQNQCWCSRNRWISRRLLLLLLRFRQHFFSISSIFFFWNIKKKKSYKVNFRRNWNISNFNRDYFLPRAINR